MNSISLPSNLTVDSQVVLKTHILTIILAILIIIIVAKLILPQVLQYYKERANQEKIMLQDGITRLVDGQDQMNVALITKLGIINENMNEIKNIFINSLKAAGHVIGIFILTCMLTFSACDSDTITIYHYKQEQVKEVKQLPDIKPSVQELKDLNPSDMIQVKTCNPRCTGNTRCNSETGKCEGTTIQRKISAIELVSMDRVGKFDPRTETYEVTGGNY